MLDLGELVARVTVETTDADRGLTAFERRLQQAARTDVPPVVVDVDAAKAARILDQLEADLRGIPDGDTEVTAETRAARAALADVIAATRGLPDGEVAVDAAVRAALVELQRVASETRGLPDGDVRVDADTTAARRSLADLAGDAKSVGGNIGSGLNDGVDAVVSDGLPNAVLGALASIPVVGAVAIIGAAIGKELVSGLEGELREDTLVARTGLAEADAARIGRAAGEAYAGNFGDSIETNFDTARVALQGGLLDPGSTARDSQAVIQSLTGVADILGEDIPRVVRATSTLIRSGLVDSADQAFDIFVIGQQNGANAAEDLLDTFTEYPAVLQRLGLSGEEALGLISQGLQAGARDSDFVADALKEFQIRATDGSKASADAFAILGLNAEDATAKIARGGQDASDGLDEVLDGLRAIEDPVKRNEAAVGLFGTKAEDLGDALYALDLDTVYDDLTNLEGAASGAISALGDNAAGQLESARRNIEVAKDGILAALAEAFGPQIGNFAENITGNREAVITFLLDVANGAIDVGRTLVNAAADGTEAFGDFVGTTGPQVLDLIAAILEGVDSIPFVDLGDARMEFDAMRTEAEDAFASFDTGSEAAADAIREKLITNGLDPAQARLNEVGFDLQTQARFTDSTTRLAGAVADIGYAADGAQLAVDRTGDSFDTTTDAGRALDEQLRTATGALLEQIDAGRDAGRTTEELTADYADNREELIRQIEAMGFSREEARLLADAYGAVPANVQTEFTTPGSPRAADEADRVRSNVEGIPNAKNTTISTTGSARAIAEADAVAAALRSIDRNVRVDITTVRTEAKRDANAANRGGTQPAAGRRADGGPVEAGLPYWVGEQGPKLIFPTRDGMVLPAPQSAAVAAAVAPQQTTSTREGDRYDVKIVETASARATARETLVQLRLAAFERNGLG